VTAPRDPATGRQLTACTPATVAAICAHLADPDKPRALRAALRRAGVHHSTYYAWQERAAAGEEPYADAVAAIEAARDVLREALADEIRAISKSGGKDDATRLNALKWQLEKLGGDDWNPPAKAEVTGKDGAPLVPPLAPVDLAALATKIDALAAGSAAAPPAGDAPPDPGGADRR
jgi:hypothetical protein